jgi:hypothetical protein
MTKEQNIYLKGMIMSERTIQYQGVDGKWHDLLIYDLIDPLDTTSSLPADLKVIREFMEEAKKKLSQGGICSTALEQSLKHLEDLLEQLTAKSEECERLEKEKKKLQHKVTKGADLLGRMVEQLEKRKIFCETLIASKNSLTTQLADAQWISVDDKPAVLEQFEVYAVLGPNWKIADAAYSWEFERFIFDGCQEWRETHYRKISPPKEKE